MTEIQAGNGPAQSFIKQFTTPPSDVVEGTPDALPATQGARKSSARDPINIMA